MRTAPAAICLLAVLSLLGTLLVSPNVASAGDRTEAESYYRRGNTLFEDGQFDEAAKMFKVCVALAPELAGPYRRLGQSYKMLGRCHEAVDQFLKYLELKPDGKYADSIRADMEECAIDAQMDTADTDRPLTGQLSLDVDEDGARVLFDGDEVGRSPVGAVAMKPGTYLVTVAKAGFVPWEEEIRVAAGDNLERSIRLEETAGGRAATTGRLVLSVDPPGARVIVDGELVGISPVPDLDLPAGSREVRIERKGYLGETHTVDLPENGQAALRVDLIATGDSGGTGAAGVVVGGQAPPPISREAGRTARTVGWVLAAAGAAAAITGVVLGTMALRKSEAYSTSDETTDRRALKDEGESLAIATDAAFASAALLATGGVLLVLGAPAVAEQPSDDVPELEDVLEPPPGAASAMPPATLSIVGSF